MFKKLFFILLIFSLSGCISIMKPMKYNKELDNPKKVYTPNYLKDNSILFTISKERKNE